MDALLDLLSSFHDGYKNIHIFGLSYIFEFKRLIVKNLGAIKTIISYINSVLNIGDIILNIPIWRFIGI